MKQTDSATAMAQPIPPIETSKGRHDEEGRSVRQQVGVVGFPCLPIPMGKGVIDRGKCATPSGLGREKVTRKLLAEPLTEPLAEVGESPVHIVSRGQLAWVDLLEPTLFLTDVDTGYSQRFAVDGATLGLVRPCTCDGLLMAVDHSLWHIDPDDATSLYELASFSIQEGLRPNDGAVSPNGDLWLGFRSLSSSGDGILCRLDDDFTLVPVVRGLSLPNGLVFDDDSATGILVDSIQRKILRLRFGRSGEVLSVETWVDLSGEDVMPDGLAMDSEGGVWVALWGGGQVVRYSPRGEKTDVVQVPVSLVSACCLSEAGNLYITTSRYGGMQATEPLAGATFVVSTNYRGKATQRFNAHP